MNLTFRCGSSLENKKCRALVILFGELELGEILIDYENEGQFFYVIDFSSKECKGGRCVSDNDGNLIKFKSFEEALYFIYNKYVTMEIDGKIENKSFNEIFEDAWYQK